MPSLQSRLLKYFVRKRVEKAKSQQWNLENKRRQIDDMAKRVKLPAGTYSETISANGIPCEWVKTLKSTDSHTLLFLHGGAYIRGSLHSHRGLAARLADASLGRALMVDYRLAPEFPFPTAVDDVISVYQWLVKRVPTKKITFVGDSAGGGLALAAILKLKEEKLPLPAAAVLMCPWVDLECSNESYVSQAAFDPIYTKEELLEAAHMYYQQAPARNPFVSPLYADLKGFPPMFIQLGTHDLRLGEGKLLAEKATAAGVKVELDVWDQMIHNWQNFGNQLPEAGKAIQKAGEFIRKRAGA
ncbi:MAG: alpha/beta hydrolase [Bacteroidota bacterium]